MDKLYPIKDGNIWMCPRCNALINTGEESCELCEQGINWQFDGVSPPDNFEENALNGSP